MSVTENITSKQTITIFLLLLTRYKKICCEGTSYRKLLEWYCCEPEPECNCCIGCDIENCPDPNVKIFLRIIKPGNFDYNARQLLYNIIGRNGGKQCCEEYAMQNPNEILNCIFNGELWITVCIYPDKKTNVITEWKIMEQDFLHLKLLLI